PVDSTRPSGRTAVVLWYTRTTLALAILVHWRVGSVMVGSHNSAANTAPASFVKPHWLLPPVTRTVPSGSMVALVCRRPMLMDAADVHVGDGAARSMISVDARGTLLGQLLPPPPPMYSTLLSSMTAEP